MSRAGGRRAAVQLVVVGKIRPPLAAAAREYEQRIGERVALRVDEVGHGAGTPAEAARREAQRIRELLVPRAYVLVLDPAGKRFASSEELAAWLGARLESPIPLAIVIGGPAGLDPGLVREADERRALGPLTLPHQLARVVLAEQLYRALCERDGHPYPR